MLNAFAKTDAASMGADRDIEFGSHEEYGKVFIDTRQAAAINLAHVDSPCLHQLFEHHAIVAVFTRRDTDRHFPADASVS